MEDQVLVIVTGDFPLVPTKAAHQGLGHSIRFRRRLLSVKGYTRRIDMR